MRVLIVEDESDLQRVLAQSLREHGYAVDVAADGEDGLFKATSWTYDAIVLDIMLPRLDGLEVLRRLRREKRTPVLLLTACASRRTWRRASRATPRPTSPCGGRMPSCSAPRRAARRPSPSTHASSPTPRTSSARRSRGILAQAELALSATRSPEDYREALAACQRAAQRLRGLVDSLLQLARIDAGALVLERRPADLAPLALGCLDLVRPLAEQRGLRLTSSLPPVEAEVDSEALGNAITNLLTNSIRYNRHGGSIDVSLARHGATATLTITDTGIGIPETDLQHVFERFYRVDKARSRSAGGSGLGLAIVRNIVEAHGGTIAVASQVDVGTTFTIELPLARTADVGAAVP